MKEELVYEPVKLIRDGKRPLTFKGAVLTSATDRNYKSTRWIDCRVWQTDKGKIVVGLRHLTQWEGESCTNIAEVFETIAEAANWIEKNVTYLAAEILNDLDVTENI